MERAKTEQGQRRLVESLEAARDYHAGALDRFQAEHDFVSGPDDENWACYKWLRHAVNCANSDLRESKEHLYWMGMRRSTRIHHETDS